MKQSSLLFGAAVLALLACKTAPADAEPTSELAASLAAESSAANAEPLDDGDKAPVSPRRAEMKKSMKAMAKLKSSEDWDALASALDGLKGKGASDMGEWDSIATAGAEAARKKDADGVNKTCKGCHKQYQKVFKSTQ